MKKVSLNSYDNSWYKPASKSKIIIWHLFSIFFFRSSLPFPQFFKKWILQLFGCEVGSDVVFKPSINIKYPWLLKIGDDVWVGEKVWIDNLVQIAIGPNVCLSQGAMLLTGNHDYKKSTFDLIIKPITLEEGVWIGAKAIVCPGVTCKSHSILSVGAVATKDLEAYSIYQGNPAAKIRERSMAD